MESIVIDVCRDTVIRRYLPLRHFKSILETKSLYFARFDDFEDRLEGGISANNFPSISDAWGQIDVALNKQWPSPSDNGEHVKVIDRNTFGESFPSLFGEQLKINGEAYLQNVRNWLYASCWSDKPHECHAMWQLFGSSGGNCRHNTPCIECQESLGTAVCIETTLGSIIDNLVLPDGFNLLVRKVEYLDHKAATFQDHELAVRPFFSKALHFGFEHELRFMVWPTDKNIRFSYKHESTGKGSTVNGRKEVRVPIKNPEAMVNKIILSPVSFINQRAAEKQHWESHESVLGLQEALANSDLRAQVEALCKEYNVSATIVDSDLNQVSAKDCYSAAAQIQC
ncbi:hypothetical protein [Pseudomonas palmensis]